MWRNNKIWFSVIVILFSALIVIKHFMPSPINWEMNFDKGYTSPYGCKVVYEMLESIFPGKSVITNSVSFYVGLQEDSIHPQNLIVITNDFSPDKLDIEKLLNFVSKGNNLFVSSYSFAQAFSDTLKFQLNQPIFDTTLFKTVKEELKLVACQTNKEESFIFQKKLPDLYFNSYDSSKTDILGSDNQKKANFICMNYSQGKIYLHCQPVVFSNYHILYSNYTYACNALSYLPVINTVWDQYYKPNKFINTSPVRFILCNLSLKAAYFILLTTILIYIIVGTKRKQRVIPLIQPLQNTSLHFIKTVGGFYYKSQNHTEIARKKSIYFLEYIRNRYYLKITDNSNTSIQLLVQKSGVDIHLVEKLLNNIYSINKNQELSKESLIEFHQRIEEFYKKCK